MHAVKHQHDSTVVNLGSDAIIAKCVHRNESIDDRPRYPSNQGPQGAQKFRPTADVAREPDGSACYFHVRVVTGVMTLGCAYY